MKYGKMKFARVAAAAVPTRISTKTCPKLPENGYEDSSVFVAMVRIMTWQ